MKNKIVLTSAFIFFSTLGIFAQTQTPKASTRQAAQRARIHDGRKSGEVTDREAALLNVEQRHIRRTKRRAKADGEVTVAERAKIQRKQNRASRHVRRAKHNDMDKND